jgi:Phosphoinositide phospholipase C, Ca2+-dependent
MMPSLRRARWLVVATCLAACSSSGHVTSDATRKTDSGSGAHPLDAVLRLNQIQAKGTHNSYHVEKPGNTIPAWMFTHDPLGVEFDLEGVRAVELDTHMDDALGAIRVYHVPGIDDGTTCNLFSDCLQAIKSWSDAHPGHHAIFVHIEPKDAELNQTPNFDAYADLLDQTILSVWPRDRVIAPADVQGDSATLRDAVTTKGWPTLGETRGKVLFYLNERTKFHAAYTRGGSDISGRIAFPESHVDEPIGGVVVLNDPTQDPIAAAVQQGFLVRTMCDGVPRPADAETRRTQALASGAHVISTDFPVPADGGDLGLQIPGGTPSRCNPVNAPSACTSEAVEDPATLAGSR